MSCRSLVQPSCLTFHRVAVHAAQTLLGVALMVLSGTIPDPLRITQRHCAKYLIV